MIQGGGAILLSAGLFAASALFSRKLETLSPARFVDTAGLRGLSPVSVAAIFLGQRAVLGDIFWAGILQYCGNFDNAREKYGKLLGYCLEATTLAPDNAQVYKYGATYLAWYTERPEEAKILLSKGIRSLRDGEDRDRLQLYLAAVEFQNTGKDQASLRYLNALFTDGDSPPLLGPILANTFERTGQPGQALRVWALVLERNGPDSPLGRRAFQKVVEIRSKRGPR